MRDDFSPWETNGDGMPFQAFLYVTGELDEAEAAAFEHRLGEDQSAREALCQAVQLSQTLNQLTPGRPNPAYRERVRERLRRRSCWRWLFGRQSYRGHPAVWSAVGAAAAVLLVMVLVQLPSVLGRQPHPPLPEPTGVEEDELIPAPIIEPPQLAANPDMVSTWTGLDARDRMARAHDEEMRRKHRTDDRLRPVKAPERKPRPMNNQAPK